MSGAEKVDPQARSVGENPGAISADVMRGVLFDTCGSHFDDDKTVWYMLEHDRVAAFEADGDVEPLRENDCIFLYHRDLGIVAAARVIGGVKRDTSRNAVYRDVEWLTPKPQREHGIMKSLPARRIKEIVGHNFYFAHTIKKPFLSTAESEQLLTAIRALLG